LKRWIKLNLFFFEIHVLLIALLNEKDKFQKWVLNPFSFVFLLAGIERYHLVLET